MSLALTLLAAGCALGLGLLWLYDTRASVREEIEAASRVAAQWLAVAAEGAERGAPAWTESRLLEHVAAVGRVRANALEVRDMAGRLRYVSPAPAYKAGREAPEWLARLLGPDVRPQTFSAGRLVLTLIPDPSRSVLDAWDDLRHLAAIALALLALLFAATWLALHRALRPLGQIMQALDRTGHGSFGARLPVYPVSELGRLAGAFNGMADRLEDAVRHNVTLERDRDLSRLLQEERETERRAIARELHDELAQSITAVRAMAGALAQEGQAPATRRTAALMLGVTDHIQEGVRAILHRLRPASAAGLDAALRGYVDTWRQHHGDIALEFECSAARDSVSDEAALAALRIVQESLTNVARHAGARHVHVKVGNATDGLAIEVADDGRGSERNEAARRGCGLGQKGMRERAALLGGRLEIEAPPAGGTRVRAWLPGRKIQEGEV